MTLIASNSPKHFLIVIELAESLRALLKDERAAKDSAEIVLSRYDDMFSKKPQLPSKED